MHRFAQNAPGIQEHIAEHDLRSLGPKSLLKHKLQIVQLTRYQSIVSEPVEPVAAPGGQPAAMEVNTDGQRDVRGNTTDGQTSTRKLVRNPVVEKGWRGSASAGRESSATQKCVAGSKATTTATNNVESGIGDLRSVAGHQAERPESMLPVEAMK